MYMNTHFQLYMQFITQYHVHVTEVCALAGMIHDQEECRAIIILVMYVVTFMPLTVRV